jgi:glycyl-tRNA synthetase beta subunit
VRVMDKDEALRRNRLAFMNEIHQALAGRFADLSMLPLSGIEV